MHKVSNNYPGNLKLNENQISRTKILKPNPEPLQKQRRVDREWNSVKGYEGSVDKLFYLEIVLFLNIEIN